MRQSWLSRLFGRSREHGLDRTASSTGPSIDDLKADSTTVEHLGGIDPERILEDEAPREGDPP